jgi:nitroreductase
MELTEAMRTTAAIHRFRPDTVSDEVLYRALDAARFAPSGGNRQGWHVVAVRDLALRNGLMELYLRSWRPLYEARLAAGGGPDAVGRRSPGTTEANDYAEHMDEVPVHLVVLIDRAALLTPFPAINQSTFAGGSSVYPFVQNLLLAIRAEGLGASLTMLLANHEAEVRELLGYPEGFAFAAHLGVGWPARPHPARLRRRPVEDFATVDRFGGSPLRAGSGAPAARAAPAAPGAPAEPAQALARVAEEAGGDPACWAGLVCPECGAVTSEGHRPGCTESGAAAR